MLDIGLYLNTYVNDELRLKLLEEQWVPPKTYDLKKDLEIDSKRVFRLEWLTTYPWLSYSGIAKGLLCRICVVFILAKSSSRRARSIYCFSIRQISKI